MKHTDSIRWGLTCALAGVSMSLALPATANESFPTLDCLVEPSMIVELSAPGTGQLDTVFVQRNDVVRKGDFVAKLESSLELAAVRLAEHAVSANANIELREQNVAYGLRTLERNKALVKTSSVSRQQIDKVETEYEISRLQLKEQQERAERALLELERTRASLDRRSVKSPINGVVSERYKNDGEYLEGQAIVQIAQLDPLHVTVIAPLSYLSHINDKSVARVTVETGLESRTVEAEMLSIDRVADAASNTFGVVLGLKNEDLSIPGGVRCQVDFN